MTVIDVRHTPRTPLPTELRTVCLTLGPAAELAPLLHAAAEVLDSAGVVPSALAPSTDAEGTWLRITCALDPSDVAALVSLPAFADHRVDQGSATPERCPACELRDYLRAT
jgi:hypothetical protein